MQDIYKEIFEKALEEIPHKLISFRKHQCISYRGFKISKSDKGEYEWRDIRNSNYYEDVDPIITENIIKNGFVSTLRILMSHTDLDKLVNIERSIYEIDRQTDYWVRKSTDSWNTFNKAKSTIRGEKGLSRKERAAKIESATKKYERRKVLYQKKRRILKEEKEELRADYAFYTSRIKTYKQLN